MAVLIQIHDVKTKVIFYGLIAPEHKTAEGYKDALLAQLTNDGLFEVTKSLLVALVTGTLYFKKFS